MSDNFLSHLKYINFREILLQVEKQNEELRQKLNKYEKAEMPQDERLVKKMRKIWY